jgi:hypothetical protein
MRLSAALAVVLAVLPAAGRAEEPTATPTATSTGTSTATSTEASSITGIGVAPEARARYDAEARGVDADAPVIAADETAAAPRLPRWGLALGGGFPDFAKASVMFRPVSRVRLFAGPAWNYFAWGVQGGVELLPWSWAVSPLLSLEAGKFMRSDLGTLVSSDGEDAAKMKPLLARVDYAYAALDLGVEIGSPRGLAFSLKVGLSWVSVGTSGAATYTSDSGSTVTLRDPALRGTLGSAKIGFHYWF